MDILNFKYSEMKENVQKLELSDSDIVVSHDILAANILVVGSTGTGKTTFLNTLKNPRYTSIMEAKSQTQTAMLYNHLFEVKNIFYMLQIIDTPGFGDNIGRSDFEQEELILKFVKQGVTDLSLVLITIKFGVRLEASQINTIMSVLRFLGKDMKANTALLFTHSENTNNEQRKEWIEKLKDSSMASLIKFCERGTFYTGMNIHSDEINKLKFEKNLRNDHFNIVKTAITAKPIKLSGEENEKIVNQFKIYESAAKDSLTLKKLLPEIPNISMNLVSKKQLLAQINDDDRVIQLLEKYKNIDHEQLKTQCLEWSKLQNAVADYIEKGGNVQKNANQIREQYNNLIKAYEEMIELYDKIVLGL